MTTVAATIATRAQESAQPWLRGPRWDLGFLILSVSLAALPYSVFLFFGGEALEAASIPGTAAYKARVFVNNLVAILIGGPHMYATFTRTILDADFRRRRAAFVASSVLVPIGVILMAISSYDSYVWLLSIFFAVASLHALQQILWLVDAYNRKARPDYPWRSRLIDYGVVFFSLYPIAVQKMVRGEFRIGNVELKYGEIITGWTWLSTLVTTVFGAFLALFVVKTCAEWAAGSLNLPKTLLIGVTVPLMLWTPAFPNMDTAFQGINTWHSFQYLALTWYANRLRELRTGQRIGFLHGIRALRRIDRGTGWTSFYGLCMAMLPVSGLLLVLAGTLWPDLHPGRPGADEAYIYIGILSVLLVHYVHDSLLFTDSAAIVEGQAPAPAR